MNGTSTTVSLIPTLQLKFLLSFISLYKFALRLALLHLQCGKVRRGMYLLMRPIDYWRVFEFPIALDFLQPTRGERILDESSPKLFALYLASKFHSVVYPMDIYDDQGLTDTLTYKKWTGEKDLHPVQADMRLLPFPDDTFDKVFSISALEHVFPAKGGDVIALLEAARGLKYGGLAVFTVPFTKQHSIEYLKKDVYERKRTSPNEKLFYQRRYDAESLRTLLGQCPVLELESQEFICEMIFHWPGKELCQLISEGHKLKRLILAPLYSLFALIFLRRSSAPLPGSDYMIACLKLRKIPIHQDNEHSSR